MKMEQTVCSQTSAHKIQTPSESPKRKNTTKLSVPTHLLLFRICYKSDKSNGLLGKATFKFYVINPNI